MTAAQFRLDAPARDTMAGRADVQVSGGALVLAPAAGDLLRIPFAQITLLTQDTPYSIRVATPGGTVVELSGMGTMTTQLAADLRDGRAAAIAAAMRPLGPPAIFTGSRGAAVVELRVHDDALLVIGDGTGPDGISERIAFAFVSAVHAEEYVITVELAGRPPLFLSRLGRRTTELTGLLSDRLTAARTRTAAFLAALVPDLDPVALGEAAGLLRDGVAVPAAVLDQLQPGLTAQLADLAVRPERRAALAGLRQRGPVALGFRQVMSAHRPAAGGTPWSPPPPAFSGPDHGRPAAMSPGLGGMMTAGLLQGGSAPGGWGSGALLPGAVLPGALLAGEVAAAGLPFGGYSPGGYSPGGYGPGYAGPAGYGAVGNLWALGALQNLGGSVAASRPMTQRPDTTRGTLTPETDDVAAVTTAGDHPAVLAFVLVAVAGRVVLEILNEPGLPTFVYDAPAPGGLAAVNRALDDAGFQPQAATRLGPALAGQAAHDAGWPAQLEAALRA